MMVLIALCFGVEFLCCLRLMCVFIFLVKFGQLSGLLLRKYVLTRPKISFLSIST